jgi:hypothetical protein
MDTIAKLAGKRNEPEQTPKPDETPKPEEIKEGPLGKTLCDQSSQLESSAEREYSEEIELEKEVEEEEEELDRRLLEEKRKLFIEEYQALTKDSGFWESFKTDLFKEGYIPHIIPLPRNQYLAVLPLDEDEIEDFFDSIDNSYITLKYSKK